MEMNLSPKAAKKIFEGEGGSYSSWSSTEFPELGEAKVGAGLLVLKPGGFALPHYADSKKLAFVLQGENGLVGLTLSNAKTNSKEEIVQCLRAGDVIPVPLGAVSWWYNHGNSDVVIIFLGETSAAYIPGEFTYFFVAGALGVLGGFSTEFISRAYNMNETEVNTLVKSQTGTLLVKLTLEEGQRLPLPHQDNANKWIRNIVNTLPDIHVEKAGVATSFTGTNFPFLEEVGLSCTRVKLEANAMLSPIHTNGNTVQVFYVAKGSGKVQIVGTNGKRFLDSNIVAGLLLIVPRFFVVAIIADSEGLECFSIKTTLWPDVGELASKQSVFNVFQSSLLQSALNVTPEFVKSLKDRMAKNEILIPPPNNN